MRLKLIIIALGLGLVCNQAVAGKESDDDFSSGLTVTEISRGGSVQGVQTGGMVNRGEISAGGPEEEIEEFGNRLGQELSGGAVDEVEEIRYPPQEIAAGGPIEEDIQESGNSVSDAISALNEVWGRMVQWWSLPKTQEIQLIPRMFREYREIVRNYARNSEDFRYIPHLESFIEFEALADRMVWRWVDDSYLEILRYQDYLRKKGLGYQDLRYQNHSILYSDIAEINVIVTVEHRTNYTNKVIREHDMTPKDRNLRNLLDSYTLAERPAGVKILHKNYRGNNQNNSSSYFFGTNRGYGRPAWGVFGGFGLSIDDAQIVVDALNVLKAHFADK